MSHTSKQAAFTHEVPRERSGCLTDYVTALAHLAAQHLDLERRLPGLGAQSSTLYRLEPDSGDLHLLAASGNRGPAGSGHALLPRGTGITGLAVIERAPVVTDNILTGPRMALSRETRERIEQAPDRAGLAVPMLVQDQVIGSVGVGDALGRSFDEEDIRLAQAFADQAAVALEHARLFEERGALAGRLRSRQARVEALLDVGNQLSRIQPVESLLARIAEVCGRLFHSNSVTFRRVEGDELVLKAIWGHSDTVHPEALHARGLGPQGARPTGFP